MQLFPAYAIIIPLTVFVQQNTLGFEISLESSSLEFFFTLFSSTKTGWCFLIIMLHET